MRHQHGRKGKIRSYERMKDKKVQDLTTATLSEGFWKSEIVSKCDPKNAAREYFELMSDAAGFAGNDKLRDLAF